MKSKLWIKGRIIHQDYPDMPNNLMKAKLGITTKPTTKKLKKSKHVVKKVGKK